MGAMTEAEKQEYDQLVLEIQEVKRVNPDATFDIPYNY